MLNHIGRFVLALAILFGALQLGRVLNTLLPLGISESIWGLLILFGFLVFRIIKVEWLLPATRPILRYMALFFLPVCAGIIDQNAALRQHLNSLLWANLLSTVLTLLLVGWLAQKWLKGESDE